MHRNVLSKCSRGEFHQIIAFHIYINIYIIIYIYIYNIPPLLTDTFLMPLVRSCGRAARRRWRTLVKPSTAARVQGPLPPNHTAAYYSPLKHIAIHCDTVSHCTALQRTVSHCHTLQYNEDDSELTRTQKQGFHWLCPSSREIATHCNTPSFYSELARTHAKARWISIRPRVARDCMYCKILHTDPFVMYSMRAPQRHGL